MSPSATRLNSSAAAATSKPAFSAVQPVINFAEKIANRPAFDNSNRPIEVTKSPDPNWSFGDGVRTEEIPAVNKVHREIDPYSSDRSVSQNYRLLISGIAPRPIGFISTVSKDGKRKNLAPFSYFQMVDHDPPMFMWDITGLTEGETTTVKPSRVKESVLSIEGKVVDMKEFEGHKPGMSGSAIFLVEATRLWVQEDASNEDFSHIELDKLRPIAQLGGMSYGRVTSTFELPRTRWVDEKPKSEFLSDLEIQKSDR
ncbi:hypothetical protein ACHAP8_003827 [Fusarium lateritium]